MPRRAEPARVDRLILLAPALDFGGNRMRDLGDRGLDEWRRTDTLQVFHYGLRPADAGALRALCRTPPRYDAFNAARRTCRS